MSRNMKSFHNHSMFSLHDSVVKPYDLVKKAKEMGITDITLTDHGSLLGIDDFMNAGKELGVNTIPGVEAYIPEHFIIVAKNYNGYRAIFKAVRDSNEHITEKGKIKKPIMGEDILRKYFEGNDNVIITSACIGGPVAKILLHNQKVDKKRDELLKKMEPLKTAAEDYKNTELQIKHCQTEIELLKAEINEYIGYTKKPYQEKIEQMKKKQQMAFFADETIEEMQEKKNHALQVVRCNEDMIAQIKEKMEPIKKQNETAKKKVNTYQALQKELKQLPYQKESEMYALAKQKLKKYQAWFPCFYIELQYHGTDEEAYVMPILAKLAKDCNIPVIAANDAHMLDGSEDSITARQIVRYNYFDKHADVSTADRELYLKTYDELKKSFSKILDDEIIVQALKNLDVLENCNVVFPKEEHYPKATADLSLDTILEEEKQKRIEQGEWDEEHEKRLQHEVNVIKKMGYVDYHLIVYDLCNITRQLACVPKNEIKNIPVDFNKVPAWLEKKGFRSGMGLGPGRGSAVGSLACNMLKITNIDPIKYNLLFERFLNPERVSMPDIDSDIATRLRPVIIRYLKWRYGERAVCSIMTKLTYAAKNAIRMASRDRISEIFAPQKPLLKNYKAKYAMLGLSATEAETEFRKADENYKKNVQKNEKIANKLLSLIPNEPHITLSDCENTIMQEFQHNEEALLIYHRAKLIEGALAGTAIHAGGVVISDNDDISDYVALAWNEEQHTWATQCDMVQVEEKGLLKMDVLGLNTIDIISECVQLIDKHKGIVIDLDHIPIEAEVFQNIYSKGFTNSVFQFESSGMKSMLTRFMPDCFEDLILLVACYRPGPMQYLDDIIAVKNGIKEISFKTPLLKDILETTYGAVVYQEQVMLIFQKLAGYSLGGADLVRRAMAKKKTKKLEQEREAFIYGDAQRNIAGCITNGVSEEVANELFDEMMDFAKYAFNKSHAAIYASLSYTTAYLKYHYPVEFHCAMLNNVSSDKIYPILEDCQILNIPILRPDINRSFFDFTIENESLRFGFHGISGIGNENPVMQAIETNRSGYTTEKPYLSLQDFVKRNASERIKNDKKSVSLPNKNIMEGLILTGCFDDFYTNRENVLKAYNEMVQYTNQSLLAFMDTINTVKVVDGEANKKQNRNNELKYLGTILSHNPLSLYQEEKNYGCHTLLEIEESGHGNLLGLVLKSDLKKTKTYRDMLVLTLNTKQGTIEVLFFDAVARENTEYEGEVIKIECDYTNDTYFGKSIHLLTPDIHQYYLDIVTLEEFERVSPILQKYSNQGQSVLYLRSLYHKGQLLLYPKLYEPFHIPDSIAKEIDAEQLD